MKKCAYCTTENRDEAIFCKHCRHPLGAAQTPSRTALRWLLVMSIFIGLGSYVFSSRLFLTPPTTANGSPTAGPAPTRRQEPRTILACVKDTTRIRRGPDTHYETIGGLVSGTCLRILGRNKEANWVYVVSDNHQTGWVAASTLPDIGDISRVSIRDDSAIANPARPTLTSAEIANGAQAYLTKIAATNIPGSPLSQYVVPCFQTADRIGDRISCRIEKTYCDYVPTVEGNPTFCSDRPAPDQTFALVVFGEDWSDYDGQCLIVSGYLEVDRGMLQIQARQRSQVFSCN